MMVQLVSVRVKLNVRQGAPRTSAPRIRQHMPGAQLEVLAELDGETVQGNMRWYRIAADEYVWSGACDPVAAQSAGAGPTAGVPRVVDLYHGDGVTSFEQAKAAGVLGVIHKATTGDQGRDNAYARRRAAARAAGLLWGAYHWGTADRVDLQVKNFLDWASPDASTLVALDFEPTKGDQMTLAMAREFLTLIEQRLGRRAVIYSGHLIKEYLGDTVDSFFGGHRLWLAQYGPTPVVQRSWRTYWLWQYSDGEIGLHPPEIPGVPGDHKGRIDCDYFAGTAEELAAQWAS